MTENSAAQTEIRKLVSYMEPDIELGCSQDSSGLGPVRAQELAKYGEDAVDAIIEALPRCSEAHWALGLIGGAKALNALREQVKSQNWRRMTAAVRAIERLGDPSVLDELQAREQAMKLMNSIGQSVDGDFKEALESAIRSLSQK